MVATVLQIEHSPRLLIERRAILEPLGYTVVSILGANDALDRSVLRQQISVVVIGHGIAGAERRNLVAHFRRSLSGVPVVSLVGKRNRGTDDADFRCPADSPCEWLRAVTQAIGKQPSSRVSYLHQL